MRQRRGAANPARWGEIRPFWRSVWFLIGLIISVATLFGAHFGGLSPVLLCLVCLFAGLLGLG